MNLSSVKWINFQDIIDERGRLTAIEVNNHIPFPVERVFYVHQVVPGAGRGGHAHRDTDQIVAGIYGSLKIDISDGRNTKTYILNDPGRGIYVPRMIWVKMYDFSPGAVCLVLASTIYDRSKSIRTWKDYLEARGLPFMEEPCPGRL